MNLSDLLPRRRRSQIARRTRGQVRTARLAKLERLESRELLAANIAAIGGNHGNRAADAIVANGDFDGTVSRISEAQFNSLSVADLKATYDVLLFTWNSSASLDANWATRIKPYLELGGDVIFEDNVNVADLSSVITVGGSAGVRSFLPVAGLVDGIVPTQVTAEHFQMSSWDGSIFSPFLMSGGSALGLYAEVGSNGGRIVVTGPDPDYHGTSPGQADYELLVNELEWVTKPFANTPPSLNNVVVTPSIVEGGTAMLTGDIADPNSGDSFEMVVDWGDGSPQQTILLPVGSTSFNIPHVYADDPGGTASDTYNVTIVSFSDDRGGSAGVSQGGSIFMTGHDILEHYPDAQNGYDDVILDYLRGAGTPGELPRGGYDIGLASSSIYTPGATPNGPSFGSVSMANYSSETAFRQFLSTIDVFVVPEDSPFTTLASYKSAIEDFFNAGGDLYVDSSNAYAGYYDFLPSVIGADGPGINTSSGFSPTAAGAAIGITNSMVNGFPTHNTFQTPDPVFTIFETHGTDAKPVSIGAQNVVISQGGLGSALAVTVSNAPPVANAGADQTVNEGDLVTLSGVFTDQGLDDGHKQEWSVVASNGQSIPAQIIDNRAGDSNGTGGSSFSFTPMEDGIYTVTYTVTDDDGGTHSDTTVINVNNVAPQLQALAVTSPISETQSATLTGTIVDVGSQDTFTLHVNWGDPNSPRNTETIDLSNPPAHVTWDASTGEFEILHQYLDDNTPGTSSDVYTVTVTSLLDDEGDAASLTSGMSINALNGDIANTDFNNATSDPFSPVVADQVTFSASNNFTAYAHAHFGSVDVFVDVHDPVSGTWTEIFQTSVVNGTDFYFAGRTLTFASQFVDQIRLRSNPGQHQTFHNWHSYSIDFGGSAAVPVTVQNLTPIASLDLANASEDGPAIAISVLTNDSDPAGAADPLTISAIDTSGTAGFVSHSGVQVSYNPNGQFERLAAGETTTDSFAYTISDGDLGTATAVVSVTIIGTNDAPVVDTADVSGGVTELITPVGNLTDSGTIGFTDVDLLDTHSIAGSVIASAGALGTLSAGVTSDTTGTGTGGEVTWNYSVPAADVEYLAEGETKVETFSITLSDGQGGLVERQITITITGTNDAPVVDTADVTGGVTELITPAGNLTDSGTIGFTDVDLLDSHSTAGSVIASVGALGTLSAGVTSDTTGTGTGGEITWNYSVPAADVEYLAVGETKVETFSITLSDGQGGLVERLITITITGTNDDPVAEAEAYSVAEDGLLSVSAAGVLANDTDVDASDTLGVSEVNGNPADVGQPVGLSHGTLTLNADGSFTYVPSGVCDVAGLVETFNYTVSDGHGGTDIAEVTITINAAVAPGASSLAAGILRIGGTAGDDAIVLRENGGVLYQNGVSTGYAIADISEIRVWGRSGNDTIDLDGLAINSYLLGGDGDDTLVGGSARDLLFGGAGSDHLTGSSGHDFLAGGEGSDRLVGSAGNDILMADNFDCSTTRSAIDELLDYWSAQEVLEEDETAVDEVFSDEDFDMLTGSSGADWFIVGDGDKITDWKTTNRDGDQVTTI